MTDSQRVCERPSFRLRKAAFCIIKDGLLEGERP